VSADEARSALRALDRRAFLRLAGAAAAAGLLPAGCGGAPAELLPAPDLVLRRLSPRGYATFQAAALRLVGPVGAASIRAGTLDPARAADRWLDRQPDLADALGQALAFLEWAVPPLLGKWRPFTRLPGPAQDRVLDELMRSRLDVKRDVFKGLRSLVCVVFYGDPAGAAGTGYPGPFGGGGSGIRDAMEPLEG
jgi:hypothetical protein